MYHRLPNYLTLNNILVENKFSFRQGHSIYMALLKLVNDITEELDKGNCSIRIFIDLSNVFDTVDHKLLLRTRKASVEAGIREMQYAIKRSLYINKWLSYSQLLCLTAAILSAILEFVIGFASNLYNWCALSLRTIQCKHEVSIIINKWRSYSHL